MDRQENGAGRSPILRMETEGERRTTHEERTLLIITEKGEVIQDPCEWEAE